MQNSVKSCQVVILIYLFLSLSLETVFEFRKLSFAVGHCQVAFMLWNSLYSKRNNYRQQFSNHLRDLRHVGMGRDVKKETVNILREVIRTDLLSRKHQSPL